MSTNTRPGRRIGALKDEPPKIRLKTDSISRGAVLRRLDETLKPSFGFHTEETEPALKHWNDAVRSIRRWVLEQK